MSNMLNGVLVPQPIQDTPKADPQVQPVKQVGSDHTEDTIGKDTRDFLGEYIAEASKDVTEAKDTSDSLFHGDSDLVVIGKEITKGLIGSLSPTPDTLTVPNLNLSKGNTMQANTTFVAEETEVSGAPEVGTMLDQIARAEEETETSAGVSGACTDERQYQKDTKVIKRWYLYQESHHSVNLICLIEGLNGTSTAFSIKGDDAIKALSPVRVVDLTHEGRAIVLIGQGVDLYLPLSVGEVSMIYEPFNADLVETEEEQTQRFWIAAVFNAIAMLSDYHKVDLPFCEHALGNSYMMLPLFPNTDVSSEPVEEGCGG